MTPESGSTETARETISVTFADVQQRRAFIRRSFVGKVLLAHWAGAPWNGKNPKAFLHSLQVETLSRRERERIVEGASRLGKSVLGGCDLVDAATRIFRSVLVVAARYDHVAHEWGYLYAGMKTLFAENGQAFPRLTYKHSQNYHDYGMDTIWGAHGVGLSTESDDGASLLGREGTDTVLGEGSHISKDIYEKRVLRALDGATMTNPRGAEIEELGRVTIYTTPKFDEGCSASEIERVEKQTKRQPHLLHYKATDWVGTVWIRTASILENPTYQKKVYDARAASMSQQAFDEQYRGIRGNSSTRVLSAFNADKHLIAMPTVDEIRWMNLGVGIDTGAYTAFILSGKDRTRRKIALGEVYTEKITLRKSLFELREMLVDILGPVFDTTDYRDVIGKIDVFSIDPASQVKYDISDDLDVALQGPDTADQKSVLQTLNRMNVWFETDELFIVENRCPVLVDQIKKYVWKIIKSTAKGSSLPTIREPRKEYDHCIDAWRFGLMRLDDHEPKTEAPAPRSFKEEWEQMQRKNLFDPLRLQLEEAAQWD